MARTKVIKRKDFLSKKRIKELIVIHEQIYYDHAKLYADISVNNISDDNLYDFIDDEYTDTKEFNQIMNDANNTKITADVTINTENKKEVFYNVDYDYILLLQLHNRLDKQ